MEAIGNPIEILNSVINLLENLPVFPPDRDNFSVSVTLKKEISYNMSIQYIGDLIFEIQIRTARNPPGVFNYSKSDLLKTIKLLGKNLLITNIDFSSLENMANLFYCNDADCLSVQNFYATKINRKMGNKT